MTDIAVIGGGPAGLTAALYAARAGRSVTVFEGSSFGGQITRSPLVENYPGLGTVSGLELGDRMYTQTEATGAELAFSGVQRIERTTDGTFLLETEDGPVTARVVIYAAGAKPRTLGLPREEDLVGRGVSYCALCDGPFFAGQDTAVAGGGNTAVEDALFLAERCRRVTLIHRRDSFRAEQALVERASQCPNLSILTETVITDLGAANGALDHILLKTADGREESLSVSGLFVAFGRVPDTELAAALAEWDKAGYLLTNERMETATPGFFAAGDCRQKTVRQLTTAVSDGTLAAVAACEWLAVQETEANNQNGRAHAAR